MVDIFPQLSPWWQVLYSSFFKLPREAPTKIDLILFTHPNTHI